MESPASRNTQRPSRSAHRTRRQRAAIFTAAALVATFLAIPHHSSAQAPGASASANDANASSNAGLATTDKDRTSLSLTVYNSNTALVRDVRQIQLRSGVFPLQFEGVSASINPVTVHFRSLTDPANLSIVEQNYEYDLLDPQKLLKKYVGREVTLVRAESENNTTRYVETKALLLSDNEAPVWKIGNEIVTGVPTDNYKFPDLPGNLYSQPTLIWTLDNRGAASQKIEVSYLTEGLNWNADYVLTISRDDKAADINGWVTLVNSSGVGYDNANLQLVAGKIHQVQPQVRPMAMEAKSTMMANRAPAPQFEQENFNEYHLYSLDRKTSIQNNESKQISLLSGTQIPVEKVLLTEGSRYYYRNSSSIGDPSPQPVKVYYRFKNSQQNSLGVPLPAGTVRVYQADSKGGTQFVGEDNIEHTPKDENVRINTGEAFDVVCERKTLNYERVSKDVFEMEYQITLRNHKDGAVSVEVREPIGGDWEVLNSNYKANKLDAGTLGFQVPVDKDGTSTLTYKVRVKW
jgi:hypothetical protein